MIKNSLSKLVVSDDLTDEEARSSMEEIMSGNLPDSQISSFLTALRMKGETISEIASFAEVMRNFSLKINPQVNSPIFDIVGTGGDLIKTFNVSTISAMVVSGSGITVAKHGNRSFTSKCGSADVLELAGVNINAEPKVVQTCIEQEGIGFLFAQKFHPAMKHVASVRREIGLRTVFNILGPITNPAGVTHLLVGVYDPSLVDLVCNSLKKLGITRAMVVCGIDGIDEVSLLGKTKVAELNNDTITSNILSPNDFGFEPSNSIEIVGGSPDKNVELMFKILNNDLSVISSKNMILANSSIALLVSGQVTTLDEGIELANESIVSGQAYSKLKGLVKRSNGDLSKLEILEKKYGFHH